MEERLQKVMSNCGVASRRASEKMILEAAYEFAPHRECHYEPKRKTGRFYTVTKEQLTTI